MGFIIYIDLPLTERDPSKFAKQLGLIQREKYELVIRYWTEAIDSSKRPTTLPIKGDFQLLFDEVVEHWRDFNFAKLAKIAQEAKNSLL